MSQLTDMNNNNDSKQELDEEVDDPLKRPIKARRTKKVTKKVHRPPARPPSLKIDEIYPAYLQGLRVLAGHAEMQGRRESMEDAICIKTRFRTDDESFFAIYDGHGSSQVSEYAGKKFDSILSHKLTEALKPAVGTPKEGDRHIIERVIKEAFLETEELIRTPELDLIGGSTASIIYIRGSRIYAANIGDSRVILCRNNKPIRLTVDHRPNEPSELERIQKLGGVVINDRVKGLLAVSRSFGDSFLYPYVTSEPYITSIDMVDEDQFIIMACDGVWDWVSDTDAIDVIRNEQDPRVASAMLRNHAFNRGSTDNISVVIIKLMPDLGPSSCPASTVTGSSSSPVPFLNTRGINAENTSDGNMNSARSNDGSPTFGSGEHSWDELDPYQNLSEDDLQHQRLQEEKRKRNIELKRKARQRLRQELQFVSAHAHASSHSAHAIPASQSPTKTATGKTLF